jgi:hypothetical protein
MQVQSGDFRKNWQRRQRKLHKSGADCAYLYAHLEADTGEIFYIGMGETPGRPWAINRRTAKHKNRIKKHGLKVEIITEPHMKWELAGWWECWWIAACRAAGFDLVNLTDGGDGLSREAALRLNGSPEARKKNSDGVRKAKKNAPDRWFNRFSPELAWEIGIRKGTKKQVAEFFGISTSTLTKIRLHIENLLGIPPQRNVGNRAKSPTADVILRRKASFKKTWANRTQIQTEDFSKKVSKGRMSAPDHWSNRLTETDLWDIATLLASAKNLSQRYGITLSQVKYIREKFDRIIGAPQRKTFIFGNPQGLAKVHPTHRTEIANKGWETRRRNQLLKKEVD